MNASPEFGFHSYLVKHKKRAKVTEYDLGNVPSFTSLDILLEEGDILLGAVYDDSYYSNIVEYYIPTTYMQILRSGSVQCTTITNELSTIDGIKVTVAGTYTVNYDEGTQTFSWIAPKETEQMTLVGDMNGDGVLSIADVTLLSSTLLGEREVIIHQCAKDVEEEPAPVLVQEITLDKTFLKLKEGETSTLVASVLPEDADNTAVQWTCSNTDVAEVTAEGVVTAKAEGCCTIIATAADGSGVTQSCELTVESLMTKYEAPTISKGGTYTLTIDAQKDQILSFDYNVTLYGTFYLMDSSWPVANSDNFLVSIKTDSTKATEIINKSCPISGYEGDIHTKTFSGTATYTFPATGTYTLTFKLSRLQGSGGATVNNIVVQ